MAGPGPAAGSPGSPGEPGWRWGWRFVRWAMECRDTSWWMGARGYTCRDFGPWLGTGSRWAQVRLFLQSRPTMLRSEEGSKVRAQNQSGAWESELQELQQDSRGCEDGRRLPCF